MSIAVHCAGHTRLTQMDNPIKINWRSEGDLTQRAHVLSPVVVEEGQGKQANKVWGCHGGRSLALYDIVHRRSGVQGGRAGGH